MKAMICRKWGSPEVLELAELEIPEPGPNQVLIRVRASAANYADLVMLQGNYQTRPNFPFGPGLECAGEIVKTGKDVSLVKPSQRVLAKLPHSGFAEFAIANATSTYAIPDSMPWEHASSFFVAYVSSHAAIRWQGQLGPGQSILVLGAAGGTGLTAVEISKAMGAKVIAAASTATKLTIPKARGADYLLNYGQDSIKEKVAKITQDEGVNLVFDPIGGEFFDEALSSLGWGGRYLVFGFVGGIPKIPANRLLVKHRSAMGCSLRYFEQYEPDKLALSIEELLTWYAEKKLQPLISKTYPLARASDALTDLAERRATGRIVVVT